MLVETIVGAVILLYAPCPGLHEPGYTVYGCVQYGAEPPVVYVQPALPEATRRFVWRHELGHVACLHTPGCPVQNERFANEWARAHPGRVVLQR